MPRGLCLPRVAKALPTSPPATRPRSNASGLEAFMPEGPDGPEIDISVPLTRTAFEVRSASNEDVLGG